MSDKMTTEEEPRTYVSMAGKSVGKCSAGHWLPLTGNCDLCGAGPDEKCLYNRTDGDRGSAA